MQWGRSKKDCLACSVSVMRGRLPPWPLVPNPPGHDVIKVYRELKPANHQRDDDLQDGGRGLWTACQPSPRFPFLLTLTGPLTACQLVCLLRVSISSLPSSLLVYIISPINIYVDTQHRFKLRVCVFARLPAHICSSSGSGHRGSLRLQQPVTLQRAILRWP